MTINQTEPIIYERLSDEEAQKGCDGTKATCPGILRAAAILFSANLLIAFGIWLSPELRVGVYGAEQESTSLYKPSPFTEVVDTSAPRTALAAAKARPVLFEEPQPVEYTESADFFLPGNLSDPPAGHTMSDVAPKRETLRGAAVDKVVDSYSDFPRVTASLRLDAQPPAHAATVEVAPRRVSEHAVRTAIN